MKKTIAKIMAAAMLLSAIPAVTLPTLTAEAGFASNDLIETTPTDISVKSANWYQDGVINSSNYTESAPLTLTGLTYDINAVYKNGEVTDGNYSYITTSLNPEIVAYAKREISSRGWTSVDDYLAQKGDADATKEAIINLNLTKLFDISFDYASAETVRFLNRVYLDDDTIIFESNNDKESVQKMIALKNGTDSAVIKITAKLNGVSDPNTVKSITLWVRLGAGTTATNNGMGFVLLKQDNAKYTRVPVNYTLDDNHYATIEEVTNTDTIKLDTAKGGRLLLDYVYQTGQAYEDTAGANNRNHASETATSNAFKIRRIGSRVFKEGKFQQISGWGDDGAKYIRTINNGAFRKCKQLKKVNLDTDKKIRKINAKAFYGDKKLATVKLDGRNLKQIGSSAFSGCKSNITFKIKGNKTQFNKAVKKIKKAAPKKAKYSRI